MRVRLFLVLLSAAAGLLLAACGGEEATFERADLPQVVLQPDDLGKAFTQFDAGRMRSADLPAGERADPTRFGRLEGRIARYRRSGSPASEGPLVVESRVDLFEGSDGAASDFQAAVEELGRGVPGAPAPVELAGLGDEASALGPGRAQPGEVSFVTIVWREANVLAALSVNGFAGRLTLAQVQALAVKQQERLEAAASEARS